MLNKPRLKILLNRILTEPAEHLDMGENCGTAKCVMGWAQQIYLEMNGLLNLEGQYIRDRVMSWYGLNSKQYDRIFYGQVMCHNGTYLSTTYQISSLPYDDQKNLAVAMLEKLIETSEVDWNHAIEHAGLTQKFLYLTNPKPWTRNHDTRA